jgi:hypothetical protein
MKRFLEILIWKFPKPVDQAIRVGCGIFAGSMLVYGIIKAIEGDGSDARAFLLMGLMGAAGMLARRTT